MEITVYTENRKTPGNEYLEAVDFLVERKLTKNGQIKDRPATLFLVNNGDIKVYPAVSLTSTELTQEELLLLIGKEKTAKLDRENNYDVVFKPETDILKTQDLLKKVLENEWKICLPNMLILLNEEPRGTCIYFKILSEQPRLSKFMYASKLFAELNALVKYHNRKSLA